MKNFNRGFIVPLLLAIIGILIVGGAYVYLQNKEVNKQTISTADWKTYTNAQYGYEISYPADATVKTSDASCVELTHKENNAYVSIFINTTDSWICGSQEPWVPAESVDATEKVVINGKSYSASGWRQSNSTNGYFSFTFDKKVKVSYGVDNVNSSLDSPSNESTFNASLNSARQIISTLKHI